MVFAVIEELYGADHADCIANYAEYEWNKDAKHDPFAKLYW